MPESFREQTPLEKTLGAGLPRRDWLLIAALAIGTFLTFLPAMSCKFVNLDDYEFVLNPHVTKGLSAEGTRWAFTNLDQGAYFPVTWLSFQLDAQLWRTQPWGCHYTNVVLHTANVVLLFLFLRRATGSSWRSAATAAFFAVHPLRVESVAWVTERKDVLCGFFGFLGADRLRGLCPQAKRASIRLGIWSVHALPSVQINAGDAALAASVARFLAIETPED